MRNRYGSGNTQVTKTAARGLGAAALSSVGGRPTRVSDVKPAVKKKKKRRIRHKRIR